jgi:hypothetical protein
MAEAFESNLPTWTDADAAVFHRVHGDIVSASVRRAVPYGVTVKLLSATGSSFGSMLLIPVVVEQLIGLLQQEGSLW